MARIHFIFENKKANNQRTINSRVGMLTKYGNSSSPMPIVHEPRLRTKWEPPLDTMIKCNIDGARKPSSAASGVLLQDNSGTVLMGLAGLIGWYSIC